MTNPEVCAWDRAEWQRMNMAPSPVPESVITALHAMTTDEGGRTAGEPAPELTAWARELRAQLEIVGVLVSAGFPVDRWPLARLRSAYELVGEAMGRNLTQSTRGEIVFSVTNEGAPGASAARGARSGTALDFHTDSAPNWGDATPDIVGLLAVHDAPEGGETVVACARTVARMVERSFPDLVEALYSTYIFDRSTELRPHDDVLLRTPMLVRRSDGVHVRFAPVYIARGHARAREPMTADQVLALISFTGCAHQDALNVPIKLAPGDCLWLNNRRMIHGRRPFRDGTARRHMLRLWIADRGTGDTR